MASDADQHATLCFASAARLQLNLVWRPRDENAEADALTNGVFDGFDADDRIAVAYHELPLQLVHELWETKQEFEAAKIAKAIDRDRTRSSNSKKFDKSPW